MSMSSESPFDGERHDAIRDRDVDLSDATEIASGKFTDDGFEHDQRFLRRIERARESLRAGQGVKLEDIDM